MSAETSQAKGRADADQTQAQAAGVNDDMQAGWRMRAGSALDDLRAEKQEQFDSLNIQVSCRGAPARPVVTWVTHMSLPMNAH